ncbi:hypothetical protein HDU67_003955 [Dinochytrium kinnereticum]|nr:hypothetical protein HDU67_003955 [Dinochytrium kinnereticum]
MPTFEKKASAGAPSAHAFRGEHSEDQETVLTSDGMRSSTSSGNIPPHPPLSQRNYTVSAQFPPTTPNDVRIQQQVSVNPLPQLFLPSTPFDDEPLEPAVDDDGDDLSKTPQRSNPLLAAMAARQQPAASSSLSMPFEIEDDIIEDVVDDTRDNIQQSDVDQTPYHPPQEVPVNEEEEEELKMEAADRVLCGELYANTTVKDMQEAINVSHPFGLKIWKPALYKKDRSINAITYSDLHSVPGRPKEGLSTIYQPGNILWVILFGWWMALAYLLVAILVLGPIAVIGKLGSWFISVLFCIAYPCTAPALRYDVFLIGHLARFAREVERTWQYSRALINLSGYILWPFGKFIAKRREHVAAYNSRLSREDNEDVKVMEDLRNDEVFVNESTSLLADHRAAPVISNDVHVNLGVPSIDSTPFRRESRLTGTQGKRPRAMSTPQRRVSSANVVEDLEGLTSDEEEIGDNNSDISGDLGESAISLEASHGLRPGSDSNIVHLPFSVSNEQGSISTPATSWHRRVKRIQAGGFSGFLFSVVLFFTLAPLHLLVTGCCFFAVVSVPMAKLNYVLLRHLFRHPLRLSAHRPEEHWDNIQNIKASQMQEQRQSAVSEVPARTHERMASGFDYESDNEDFRNIVSRNNYGEGSSTAVSPDPPEEMMNSIIMSPGTPPLGPSYHSTKSNGNALSTIERGRPLNKGESRSKMLRPVSVFVDTGAASIARKAEAVAKNSEFQTSDYLIVLCTYNAVGLRYYKYTVDGVNIIFINLLAIVIFTLLDFYYLGPLWDHKGMGSYTVIFSCALLSVIPLSYFIGMAVSSITAQTGSLALGAVVNATFGSIVEVILYCLALMEGKTRMVEGAIVGSFMAGLLALPGVSMFSGGLKRKEQKFNSKAATVTSTMLIISVIGVFGPTLFQEVYGTFELQCLECPVPTAEVSALSPIQVALSCKMCRYHQPAPTLDPIYQKHTRPLMYGSAVALLLVYAVGLWFTLRTHSKRIYNTKKKHRRTIRIVDLNVDSIDDSYGPTQQIIPPMEHQTPTLPHQDRPMSADVSGLRSRSGRRQISRDSLPVSASRPANGSNPSLGFTLSPNLRPTQTSNSASARTPLISPALSPMRSSDTIYKPPPIPPSTPQSSVHGLGISSEDLVYSSQFQQKGYMTSTSAQQLSALRPRLNIAIPNPVGSEPGHRYRPYQTQNGNAPKRIVDDMMSVDSTTSSSDSESDLLSAVDSLPPGNRGNILGSQQTTNSSVEAYHRGLAAASQASGRAFPLNNPRSRTSSLRGPLESGQNARPSSLHRGAVHGTSGTALDADARMAIRHSVQPGASNSVSGGGGGHGHDHPNWTSAKSTMVLLGATVLFSLIAEVLIDAVDHVIGTGGGDGKEGGWAVDEKLLGLTLFAIVPTVTEFYNAIAFAQMGNIALSLEIGSAYTIQVALLQIPILVGFSAYWRIFGGSHSTRPKTPHAGAGDAGLEFLASATGHRIPFQMIGKMVMPLWEAIFINSSNGLMDENPPSAPIQDAFSLVFPRWDLVAVLFSVFTVTYLYIEGKSNYFKGAMLLLAYGVLMLAFFYAPPSLSSDS